MGLKFMGLATADMTGRLPHLINANKIVFSSKRPSPSAGTPAYFDLALLYKGNCPFLTRHSPSSS
jgi:hypothetical protein